MSNQAVTQQDQMVRGTLWLTVGNFASRLMGALYVIPWLIWMGEHSHQANALFSMGYTIYAIFLNMSTAGINVAVAKQIAKYNSMGKPDMSFKLIRVALAFMMGLGLFFGALMYLGAPLFARLSGVEVELVPVMRSLSWAVLIFPAMSIVRGIFQGLNDMKPYAMSQVVEQLIRLIWMLLVTFFIMQVGSRDYVKAVTQSTFAAFIGMLASVVVLLYYLWKAKLMKPILETAAPSEAINSRAILLETVKEAIPFIVTGAAIQIFQLIDQFSFINTMSLLTDRSQAELEVLFSYFSANPNKIFMILISVATAIGGVGIPLLTENVVKGERQASAKLILNSLTMLIVFLLPAVLGSILLAKPLYTTFYGLPDSMALSLFVLAMLTTLILGVYTVLAPMLQALFENRNAVKYFLYGALVKLTLQLPLIVIFHAYGPILATAAGLAIPVVLMARRIKEITGFDQVLFFNRGLLIILQTLAMGLVVLVLELLLNWLLPVTSRSSSMVHLILGGTIGGGLYVLMSLATRSIDFVIGKPKADRLRHRLKMK
ncbi:putative polysaccharide biosynthesis protein [Streptococcus ovuberis]|uniref:Polysaccharide biosynthesis protein n=1 Tax=Streptococcus ovuberis TaxID=1936207 RepID=A0A7X6RZU4_9STRE|nr:polysaccharide biosynthesis protein [Streptococcus ovuberis]NKZ19399.1 polysaccharide biosynthesis protein [Streptococcus ovuberis]